MSSQLQPQGPSGPDQPPVPIPDVPLGNSEEHVDLAIIPAEMQAEQISGPERIDGQKSFQVIDMKPLVDPELFHEQTGLFGNLVASIQVGESAIGIVDRDSFLRDHNLPEKIKVIWSDSPDDVNGARLYKKEESLHAVILDAVDGVVRDEHGMPKLFPLRTDGALSIGREEDNDINLPDSTVSAHHADIIFDVETGEVTVKDRNSTNGTFIETKPKDLEEGVADDTDQQEQAIGAEEDTVPNDKEWWNTAVDAAKNDVEGLPEPPKSVEETGYDGELPPVYDPDNVDNFDMVLQQSTNEEQPNEEILRDEDFQAILASPESFTRALTGTEVDPQIQGALRGVVEAWQELQHSEVAKVLWEETIRPHLQRLNQIGIPERSRQLEQLTQGIQQFGETMVRARVLIDNREYEGLGPLVRKAGIDESTVGLLRRDLRNLLETDIVHGTMRNLGLDTEDADGAVKRLQQRIDGVTLEPNEAEQILSSLEGVASIAQLQVKSAEMRDQITFRSWRGIVRGVDELSGLSLKLDRNLKNGDIDVSLRQLEVMYQDFTTEIRRGRIDSELPMRMRGKVIKVMEVLESARRMSSMLTDDSVWLQGR